MAASQTFTVVFWNILFDTLDPSLVPPQATRYKHIAHALKGLGKSLDVVCLSEIEDSPTHGKLGEKIAEIAGYPPGIWTYHAREREQIGIFGKQVNEAEFLMLENGTAAAMTSVNDVAIVGVHLTYTLHRALLRKRQITQVLDELEGHDRAIIMGDFNSLPWQTPRRLIESYGYTSVFEQLKGFHPITSPIPEFHHMLSKWQRLAVGEGFAADDIYIKGDLKIVEVGTLKSESDHLGVWATFKVPTQKKKTT